MSALDKFLMPQTQLAKRRLSIGGSDANTIMSGDETRLMALWEEKLGRGRPQTPTLNMLMGSVTEELNAAWYEHNTGDLVSNRQMTPTSEDRGYLAHATLDGTCKDNYAIWEAKHTSGYDFQAKDKRSAEAMAGYYLPQLQHNMMVTGLSRAVLSVFFDNNRWEFAEIEADPFYQDVLAERELNFWKMVQDRKPPMALEEIKVKVAVVATKSVDMTGNNEWAAFAADWLQNKEAASKFDSAVSGLKGLMEADVGIAKGYGVFAKKDKRGSVKLSVD